MREAASNLEPLHQGACDYLCGIYSIINAIRLASYPTYIDSHALFEEAISHLIAKDRLAEVMQHGMATALSRRLLNALLSGRNCPVELKAPPQFPILPAKSAFTRALAGGTPVLFELSGHCYHYTVATELKGNRLILFDSDGMKWINISSLPTDEATAQTSRYQIAPKSMVAIAPA